MRLNERYEFVNGEIRRILTPEEVEARAAAAKCMDAIFTRWDSTFRALAAH